MDYKQKYLKYKQKYLNLHNKTSWYVLKKNNFKSLHHKANKIIDAYELSSTDSQL